MSNLTLTKIRIVDGRWEGYVSGTKAGIRPDIQVRHLDSVVEEAVLSEGSMPGQWSLTVPIPARTIYDGVQTYVILDGADDTKLGEFTLIAGDVATDNLRVEVELLRAELDMLKRAFRRHCRETM